MTPDTTPGQDTTPSTPTTPRSRFMRLDEVAQTLDVTAAQAYALVRSGELPAIKIGGRGQWRIERSVFEDYLRDAYAATAAFVAANPLGSSSATGQATDHHRSQDAGQE